MTKARIVERGVLTTVRVVRVKEHGLVEVVLPSGTHADVHASMLRPTKEQTKR